MKKLLVFGFAIALVLFSANRAQADDFNPPDWRGDPLSVEAEWNFEGGIITSYAPDYFNAVGSQEKTLDSYWTHIDGTGAWVPDPDDLGPKGAGADYFGGFVIHLANWNDDELYKDIRLQLTGYYLQSNGPVLEWDLPYFDITASPLNSWTITDGGVNYDLGQDITRAWYDIRIWPNPDNEDIWFDPVPGIVIDQIYVDTISIPEPASVAMMALVTGFGLFIRRKFML